MAPSAPTTIEVSSTDIPPISVKGSTSFTRLPPKQRIQTTLSTLSSNSRISKTLSVSSRHTQDSGDHYNDIAGAYANEDRLLPPNPKVIPDVFMTPLWDHIGPIDRDIRNTLNALRKLLLLIP
ncbi:hypothetical protein RhiirA1_450030 [Rhizophagus irregularis]|nr:hypothetical protein RhiirA1_450030 [Rhizophagus irregularis]